MSNKNKNQCETDQSECCETGQSKYTQVKTGYARAAVILLAVNFCLTGYVLTGLMKIQDEQADSSQSPQPLSNTATATPATPATPAELPQTLEKEDN
ncbi:hypothetical protein CMI37_15370 [Candidatus Pacearchaeota archaeon]|jgi:hypothetical protein|nr:hypothetical protein [Candidatus Pacearchaeota archaeon]